MERHLEQDNAFHISDLAFCLAAFNTCIIIMRLLIHYGEYQAFVVPCHHYGMFKVFSQAFLSECRGRGEGCCQFNLKCLYQTACNTKIGQLSDMFSFVGGNSFFPEI